MTSRSKSRLFETSGSGFDFTNFTWFIASSVPYLIAHLYGWIGLIQYYMTNGASVCTWHTDSTSPNHDLPQILTLPHIFTVTRLSFVSDKFNQFSSQYIVKKID